MHRFLTRLGIAILTFVFLASGAFSKISRQVQHLRALDNRGVIQLTKFHYYERGRLNIESKFTKPVDKEGTLKVVYLLYKKKIWEKIDPKL